MASPPNHPRDEKWVGGMIVVAIGATIGKSRAYMARLVEAPDETPHTDLSSMEIWIS